MTALFGVLSVATAVLCLALFVVFVVNPGAYSQMYGVAADTGGTFLGRRAAPLFLGLAVFVFALRGADPGPLRDASVLAVAVTFAGIAVTGIAAYLTGPASFAVLVAAGLELGIAALWILAR